MVRRRWLPMLLVLLLIGVGAGTGVVSRGFAAEWPADRQFVLVAPPVQNVFASPPGSVAEAADGALLVLIFWPVIRTSKDGSTSAQVRSRLVRVAADGSLVFVPPFGDLAPGSGDPLVPDVDEIVPLPDGSILFSRFAAIDLWRPDGSIRRVAGGLGFGSGLARRADGSILFGDNSRVRQIAPDGLITTVAGTGDDGAFGADGEPSDVLPTADGGVLIADAYNGRVRRVGPDGVISTVAGTVGGPLSESFGDGGPATAAGLVWPHQLARLPDGSLLIAEQQHIRQVSTDGTISTVFQVPQGSASRLGDFAGRYGNTIGAMDVTKEGGIAVIVDGDQLRAYYLAPPQTRRTLVGLRDARASHRRVKVTVDATSRGSLRLQVRRHGKVVARATRRVRPGRRVIAVRHRFARAYHDVSVTLRAKRGASQLDHVRVFTSTTLPERLVIPRDVDARACKRIDRRRIDCETRDNPSNEEDAAPCLNTSAYRLFASGILFTRPYGADCHRKPIPFDRRPKWTAPWARP